MQHMGSSMQNAGSLVMACEILVVDEGSSSLTRDQARAFALEHGVLATGSPEKFPHKLFYVRKIIFESKNKAELENVCNVSKRQKMNISNMRK